ncbi:protein SENSITIVE TO UV 2 isoform X2 [Malania oleifera]|uniref:protein SENSITIVE TO UV 2 isoform X2 n=1 Tax=Malania oleifera TaxID=397392 RepID=UPI0025AE7F44|nr:protein SENSITIVE TO UV 2 isoform X2 [Malania oleifera]
MSEGGFEEWDADFLDQLIHVEELALSSTAPPSQPHPATTAFSHPSHLLLPPQPPSLLPPPPPPPYVVPSHDSISYSPPRELSQRIPNHKPFDHSSNGIAGAVVTPVPYIRSGSAKELEIDGLKRELGRVSKQLTNLEQECLELRKERDKKEEQLKSIFSQNEAKDGNALKDRSLEYGFAMVHPGIAVQCQNVSSSYDHAHSTRSCKSVGLQTDKTGASSHLTTNNDLSKNLLAIWGSPSCQILGRNLVSKLFEACPTDFQVLFGCMRMNTSSKMMTGSDTVESSFYVPLQDHMHHVNSSEALKVSHLYSILTKNNNGMVQLDALIEALLDLCRVENVVIVYRCLRILRAFLSHVSFEGKSKRRDSVMVEGVCSSDDPANIHGSESANTGGLFCASKDELDSGYNPFGRRFIGAEITCKMEYWNHLTEMSFYNIEWVNLFEAMRQIALMNTNTHVKLEAVSIMNIILSRTNAYVEREEFGQVVMFESVSQWLRKDAGLRVQKQAVHLLYLLLNCPKVFVAFCSGCKKAGKSDDIAHNDMENASREFIVILDGLADCIACCGSGTQDLKLRRHAITVLAFLASSGKSVLEFLLGNRLSGGMNFLSLILRVLVSEIDVGSADSTKPPEIFKERALLIREALIFLNRLVSNPTFSTTVLRALTNNRDMASSTIYIANRLSMTSQKHRLSDNLSRQTRESEIVDLARVFKKRVFAYLGDNIS